MTYCFNCNKAFNYKHVCIHNIKSFIEVEEYNKLAKLRKDYLKYNNYNYNLYSTGKVDLVKYNEQIKKELAEYLYHPTKIEKFLENNEDIDLYLN
jgi:hypothetical protein